MKTKNYYFLSCSTFNVFRIFWLNLIFLFFMFLFSGSAAEKKTWIYYGILSLIFHLVYLLAKMGSIRVSKTFSGAQIKVSTLFHECQLQGPLQSSSWWNYDFEDVFVGGNFLGDAYEGVETKSHQGHTIIWLKLKDANGKELMLFESISISDKSTDPHPYDLRTAAEGARVFQIQNINGLLHFFKQLNVIANKQLSHV